MKVSIEYHDTESFGPDEVRANIKSLFGDAARVEVLPDSIDTHSLIYFAVQQLVTPKQIDAYFHDEYLYPSRIRDLKTEVINAVSEIFDLVTQDNEDKLE